MHTENSRWVHPFEPAFKVVRAHIDSGVDGNVTERGRLTPTRVGADERAFGRSKVLMVICGANYTLAVTEAGALWSFGWGANGALGHNDNMNRLVLF
jgi:alpha-tubulin suppressor-like RCC1 family protein